MNEERLIIEIGKELIADDKWIELLVERINATGEEMNVKPLNPQPNLMDEDERARHWLTQFRKERALIARLERKRLEKELEES